MRIKPLLLTGLLSLTTTPTVNAYTNPLIALDYGTFQGKYDSTYNISYFRKIPFAAPPTGENRFRAPQPPAHITNGIYDTDQDFDMCPQRTVNGSEDCLYLGLFSRPWDTSNKPKRPVLVVFYGGAFIQGSASSTLPPSSYPVLNASTLNDYIVIYPNYRVNAFGFLPGSAIKESSKTDLNAGLLDQEYVLKWVKKHIKHFGGDEGNVTIWGQSAGAGSVVAQVLANGNHRGGQPKLFEKALASSPFWPKTYEFDSVGAEGVYKDFVNLTGCAVETATSSDGDRKKKREAEVDCLKNVDVQVIRDASLIIAASNTWTTSSYTWAPVIDGEFLTETLSEAVSRGNLKTEFVWGMYNSHEGENFVPSGLESVDGVDGFNSSVEGFHHWLVGFLPGLSEAQIRLVEDVYYPEIGSTETITEYNSSFVRAGLIYRDVVLACPAYWVGLGAKEKGYLGEYTISPATHGSDTIYWNRINAVQATNPVVYKGYAGAFASFFQTGGPNAHKLTDSSEPGVPVLQNTGEEFVIVDDGFENIRINELKKRCDFWRRVGKQIPV